MSTSCFIAARMVGRLMPNRVASSTSPPSLLPRGNRPFSMAASNTCAAW
ncbi:MAG TPA: hypothetical protein VKA51_09585 [Rubrobacteraceae bacterium]|nr:hypothetical protein [Rubrobacteraceae bacterium]